MNKEHHYEDKVKAALKVNNTSEAIKLCFQWQQQGPDALSNPLFFLAKTASHLKRGNVEAAQYNLAKTIELLRN